MNYVDLRFTDFTIDVDYRYLVNKILLVSAKHSTPSLAKPRVSLTAPNCDHIVQVSLMVLDYFLDAIAKAKKLIRKYIAQNLKQVSLTKSFLALAMVFNLLLSNST